MEIGTALGFVFTLLIFSYLLGDNLLYRLAIYVFVGLAAAFTTLVTLQSVILPALSGLNSPPEVILGLVAMGLAVLLLLKPLRLFTTVSRLALGLLIGVGAAVALVGAVTGTLIPLALETAAVTIDGLLEAVIIFIGVATSLIYFQVVARQRPDGVVVRGRLTQVLGAVGQGFVVLTLGALYGAAILTSLTILVERVSFLLTSVGVAG